MPIAPAGHFDERSRRPGVAAIGAPWPCTAASEGAADACGSPRATPGAPLGRLAGRPSSSIMLLRVPRDPRSQSANVNLPPYSLFDQVMRNIEPVHIGSLVH